MLNRPLPSDPVSNDNNTNQPVIDEISTNYMTKAEIQQAIKSIKNGKAGGKDEIIGELLKVDITTSVDQLQALFKAIWDQEEVPNAWKQGLIVKIPKKGDLTECGNWRGITLTSVPSKVFGIVLINRIRNGVNSKLRDEQAFRIGRGRVSRLLY